MRIQRWVYCLLDCSVENDTLLGEVHENSALGLLFT
jgi:hypothetical protein